MARIWAYLRSKQRIAKQTVVEAEIPDTWAEAEAMRLIGYELDIPQPMWLSKHENEMQNFSRTAFTPDQFVENVNFDQLVIEILHEKRRSNDPRNDFSF